MRAYTIFFRFLSLWCAYVANGYRVGKCDSKKKIFHWTLHGDYWLPYVGDTKRWGPNILFFHAFFRGVTRGFLPPYPIQNPPPTLQYWQAKVVGLMEQYPWKCEEETNLPKPQERDSPPDVKGFSKRSKKIAEQNPGDITYQPFVPLPVSK